MTPARTASGERSRRLRGARPVVVVDPAADLGALVVAAETATTPAVAFMVRQTSGFLCAAAPTG